MVSSFLPTSSPGIWDWKEGSLWHLGYSDRCYYTKDSGFSHKHKIEDKIRVELRMIVMKVTVLPTLLHPNRWSFPIFLGLDYCERLLTGGAAFCLAPLIHTVHCSSRNFFYHPWSGFCCLSSLISTPISYSPCPPSPLYIVPSYTSFLISSNTVYFSPWAVIHVFLSAWYTTSLAQLISINCSGLSKYISFPYF